MSGRNEEVKKETVAGPLAKEVKSKYAIAEVQTQTDLIIMNRNNEKETYSVLTAVCKIMNDIEEINEKIK